MIKLHPLNQNGNKYCGPSAISILAGIGTKEAALLIRKANPIKMRVRGTGPWDLRKTLHMLGFDLQREEKLEVGGSVKGWLARHGAPNYTYVLVAGHHWLVVQGRETVVCGISKEEMGSGEHPYARKHVKEVYRVTQFKNVDAAAVVAEEVARKKANAWRVVGSTKGRTEAKRLAEQYGIVIDKEPGMESTWVGPPDWMEGEELDPYYDDHYVGEWSEILERVKGYVEAIKKLRPEG